MTKIFSRHIMLSLALFAVMSGNAWAQSSAPPTGPVSNVAAQAPATPPVAAPAALPDAGLVPVDFSPWQMFLNAGIGVKIVLVILALEVVLTWTIWLVKTLELIFARRGLEPALHILHTARNLADAAESLGEGNGVARALLGAAREEWLHSRDALDDRDGLKERVALHLERVEAAVGRHMIIGTGVLATIGATAPFVGLFGTVWGIMTSFAGIAQRHTSNLAVVAPGIAEALLATAAGLVAAIPAVIIYNHFTRRIGAYKAQIADASTAVMRLTSRDLSRGVGRDGKRAGPLRAAAE